MRYRKSLAIAAPLLTFTTHYYLSTDTPSLQPKWLAHDLPAFKKRKDHLAQVTANPDYDVVVIGGGCNGVGVLLDASTRGLRTLLIEKDDFGAGASSKSTKLIHGGVRYLQQAFSFDMSSLSSRWEKFKLVRQAITERSLMIDSAPHLTTKIPFIIPTTNIFNAIYYYIGSLMYYAIYAIYAPGTPTKFNMPFMINRTQLTQIFPHIDPKYTKGVVYEDGSFNDARHLLASLLTATTGNGLTMPECFKPGNAINRTECVSLQKDEKGKICGVVFRDNLTKKEYKVKAKYVVNCTGVWADKIRLMDNPQAKKRIVATGGSHITYDNKVGSSSYGLCAPSSDGRILLVVPWLNRIIAGTTQQPFEEPTNNPTCTEKERQFINKNLYQILSQMDPGEFVESQKARWSGIRPLVADDVSKNTKDIARHHVIEESSSGMLSLMGGKWTTFRKMGEDTVDVICDKEKEQGRQLPSSQTAGLPLLGAAPSALKAQLFKKYGDVGVEAYHCFGTLSQTVLNQNTQRAFGSTSIAQLEWIVKNQLVTDIEDVLMRRTRLCFLVSKQEALSLAGVIGKMLQKQNGWSQKETDAKIKASIERILSYEFD